VHDTYAQDQLLRVVVIKYAIQVRAKVARDLLRDLLHGQLLVRHALAIQLDAQQPRGQLAYLEVRHVIVDLDPLIVLLDHRILRVWIVVDGRV